MRSLQTIEITHASVYTEALMVWSRLGLLRRSLPVSNFHLKQMMAVEVVRLPRRPQPVKLRAWDFLDAER